MFSIDYPFESIPNGCVWYDDHVPINGGDLVDIGRNNALRVFPKLAGVHKVQQKGERACGVGGLGLRGSKEVEYGLYNKDWSGRLERK